MKGNLYGVDIKLTPENKPYLIEVNGQGSGTNGFVKAYGDLRTQGDILTAMNQFGNGKPIYRESEAKDSEGSFSINRLFWTAIGRGATFINDVWGRRLLDIQQEWVKEGYNRQHENKEEGLFEEKYRTAAKKLGIDFRPHDALKLVDSQTIRVKRESGDYDEVHPEDIGIIWSGHKIFSRTNEFDDVVVNPYIVQKFLGSKLYLERLLGNSQISDHMPKSVPYGMGLVHDIPDCIGGNGKVVYKPNSARAGLGVRVFDSAELGDVMDIKKAEKANIKLKGFFSKYCDNKSGKIADVMVGLELNAMELYTSLIQEFIPSKPIRSSETGLDHDSCIRAIVFDGKFIDAYHRLSPTPLSGIEGNSKYVGNLSNGAMAELLSDGDKEVVAEFSERTIRTLEEEIEATQLRANGDFGGYREKFWRDELDRVKI